jgi:hypothetical protein
MPSRRSRYKPKKPCQKHLLPWGHDTPKKSNIPFDHLIQIITCDQIPEASTLNNILVYWDRGDLRGGDEAKMAEMKIDS